MYCSSRVQVPEGTASGSQPRVTLVQDDRHLYLLIKNKTNSFKNSNDDDYAALAGLELAMWISLTSNSETFLTPKYWV